MLPASIARRGLLALLLLALSSGLGALAPVSAWQPAPATTAAAPATAAPTATTAGPTPTPEPLSIIGVGREQTDILELIGQLGVPLSIVALVVAGAVLLLRAIGKEASAAVSGCGSPICSRHRNR